MSFKTFGVQRKALGPWRYGGHECSQRVAAVLVGVGRFGEQFVVDRKYDSVARRVDGWHVVGQHVAGKSLCAVVDDYGLSVAVEANKTSKWSAVDDVENLRATLGASASCDGGTPRTKRYSTVVWLIPVASENCATVKSPTMRLPRRLLACTLSETQRQFALQYPAELSARSSESPGA